MNRDRALQVLLVPIGLFFVAGIYPLATSMRHPQTSDFPDQMMLAIYFVLGIFLLLAIRNPAANRSLLAFAGWGNLAHVSVMAVQSVENGTSHSTLPILTGMAAVCVAVIALIPSGTECNPGTERACKA